MFDPYIDIFIDLGNAYTGKMLFIWRYKILNLLSLSTGRFFSLLASCGLWIIIPGYIYFFRASGKFGHQVALPRNLIKSKSKRAHSVGSPYLGGKFVTRRSVWLPQDTPRYPKTLQDIPGHQYFRILTLNNSTYDRKESQINTICPKYDIFFQW